MQNTTNSEDNQLTPDVRQALKDAEDALIAAGIDPDAYLTAARRHTEGIRNMMLVEVVPSFERAIKGMLDKSGAAALTGEIGEIKALLKNQSRQLATSDQIARGHADWQKSESQRRDVQADRFIEELNALPAAVQEAVASELGKAIIPRIEGVEAGMAELAGQINEHGERIDTLDARLVLVEEQPGSNPALFQSIARIEKDMRESKIDRAGIRSELRQTRYIAYVIVAIFVFVVLVQLWRG